MGPSASKSQVPGGRFFLGSSKALCLDATMLLWGLESKRVYIGSDRRHDCGNTFSKNIIEAQSYPHNSGTYPERLPWSSISNRLRQFTPHSVLLTNGFYFMFNHFDQFWGFGKHNDQKYNANDEKQDAQDQFSDANDEKTRKIENCAPKNTTQKRR